MLPSARKILRKHALTKAGIYASRPPTSYKVLDGREASILEVREGYLLATALVERRDDQGEDVDAEEAGERLLDTEGQSPNEYTDHLSGEIISCLEGRVVGWMQYSILHMEDLLTFFDPGELYLEYDAFDKDSAEMFMELRQARSLRHLVTEGVYRPNLLYIQLVRLEEGHRGAKLGLAVLAEVMKAAAEEHGCRHAILLPSPLDMPRHTQTEIKAYEAARRKLSAYYMRLGFEPTRKRSNYLHMPLLPGAVISWETDSPT